MIESVINVLEQCIEDFEVRIKNNDDDSIKHHATLLKRLKSKYDELCKKELSQWEKYTEEQMPKHIFDALNEKVLKEKQEVQEALCKASESMPERVDYEEKLYRFKDALEALKDPEVPAAKKNKFLKACIERIEYKREKSERRKREPGQKKGTGFDAPGGRWTSPPIELDIQLRL